MEIQSTQKKQGLKILKEYHIYAMDWSKDKIDFLLIIICTPIQRIKRKRFGLITLLFCQFGNWWKFWRTGCWRLDLSTRFFCRLYSSIPINKGLYLKKKKSKYILTCFFSL
jgi:hypothetical protein